VYRAPLNLVDPSGHRTCGPNADPLDETCDENMDSPGYGDDGPDSSDQIGEAAGVYDDGMFQPPVFAASLAGRGILDEGWVVHIIVEADFMIRYPGAIGTDIVGKSGRCIEQAGPNGGCGYPDIIYGRMVWEIKGPSGADVGAAQITRYVKYSQYVAGEGYAGTTLPHYVPTWKIETREVAPGVIVYQIIDRGKLVPVPVPRRVEEAVNQENRNRLRVSANGWFPRPSPAMVYTLSGGAGAIGAGVVLYAFGAMETYKIY
jgi:hypothetical protein